MASIPNHLHFTKSHEWVKEENGLLVIGISDYAQSSLGDIVFVDMKEPGSEVTSGDSMGTIESVKAAEDVYSPVSGTVEAINESLGDNPELVNQAPYESWLIKIKDYDSSIFSGLMDSSAYKEYLDTLDH